ncbi:MAG TPA: hypothetical protein VIM13_05815 [Clostridia bacterium]
MSVKPVDFQIAIPRSVDAAKAVSDEIQKNAALQQQKAASVQNKAEDTLKQVYSRSKTEEVRITEKQKEQGRQGESRKKKEEDKEKDSERKSSGKIYGSKITSSRIDIRI